MKPKSTGPTMIFASLRPAVRPYRTAVATGVIPGVWAKSIPNTQKSCVVGSGARECGVRLGGSSATAIPPVVISWPLVTENVSSARACCDADTANEKHVRTVAYLNVRGRLPDL